MELDLRAEPLELLREPRAELLQRLDLARRRLELDELAQELQVLIRFGHGYACARSNSSSHLASSAWSSSRARRCAASFSTSPQSSASCCSSSATSPSRCAISRSTSSSSLGRAALACFGFGLAFGFGAASVLGSARFSPATSSRRRSLRPAALVRDELARPRSRASGARPRRAARGRARRAARCRGTPRARPRAPRGSRGRGGSSARRGRGSSRPRRRRARARAAGARRPRASRPSARAPTSRRTGTCRAATAPAAGGGPCLLRRLEQRARPSSSTSCCEKYAASTPWPSRALPAAWSRRPRIVSSSVVFPEPFGPTSATCSPRSSAKVASSSSRRPTSITSPRPRARFGRSAAGRGTRTRGGGNGA